MFFRIGLKNVFKYRKRSIIMLLLSSATTALLVFASAFMDGSHRQMIENAVEIYLGYLQITNRSFRDNPSYENLIFQTKPLRDLLSSHADVVTFVQTIWACRLGHACLFFSSYDCPGHVYYVCPLCFIDSVSDFKA